MLGLMSAVAAAEVVVVEVVAAEVLVVVFALLVVFVPTTSTAVFALTVATDIVAAAAVKLFVVSFEMVLRAPTAAIVEFVAPSSLNGADMSFPNEFAAIVGL